MWSWIDINHIFCLNLVYNPNVDKGQVLRSFRRREGDYFSVLEPLAERLFRFRIKKQPKKIKEIPKNRIREYSKRSLVLPPAS